LNTFRQALQEAQFTITADLSLQGDTTVDEALRQASDIAGCVDAVQLAEYPDNGIQASPLALSSLLLKNGIDPIPRLNCRDRNRIALQSDLLGLRALGVSSLILNRGDRFAEESAPVSKPVFDISCHELVAMASAMNEEEWAEGDHEFIIGTSAAVIAPDSDWNAEPLRARANAGARFLQIKPCPDLELLHRFMERLVEEKLTWNYSVVVTLPPPAEDIDTCAGLIREISSIPGITGVNLPLQGDPGAVKSAIRASGLRS
jgi:5,10-methylenetetrahydrofolate reductase